LLQIFPVEKTQEGRAAPLTLNHSSNNRAAQPVRISVDDAKS